MKKLLSILVAATMLNTSAFCIHGAELVAGDVTGDGLVDAKDTTVLRRHIATGWTQNINLDLIDIDNSGIVEAKDASALRRFLADGWEIELVLPGSGNTEDGSETVNPYLITKAGTYTFKGDINDVMITVDAPAQEVILVLEGANINNSAGPALFVREADKVIIQPAAGTTNTISDGSSYIVTDGGSTLDGAIFSKGDLKIDGEGTLIVNGNYKHGIVSKDNLTITNGTLEVVSQKTGLNGKDCVKIHGGNVTIEAGSDGICSDNIEDPTRGYVEIIGGTIDITAASDGIQAYTYAYIEGGNTTINSIADGIKTDTSYFQIMDGMLEIIAGDEAIQGASAVLIDGGSIVADSVGDGIASSVGYVNVSTGNINIISDNDGIQGETDVTIRGGEIVIDAAYDGIVAVTGKVDVSGGNIDVTSGNDGIQSETSLYMSAGEVDITSGGGSSHSVGSSTESFKGMKTAANIEISGGVTTINSADDCIHANVSVNISGGTITGSSGDDGIHADTDLIVSETANITITKSYEGMEATNIKVNGGSVSVTASDDGINAAGGNNSTSSSTGGNRPGQGNFSSSTGTIVITGGKVYVKASGDGIDANGTLDVSGGEIIVSCPTSGDTSILDYDSSASITGGSFVGTGSQNMAQNFKTATQGSIAISTGNQSANSVITVKDSNGNVLISRIADQSYNYVIISCEGLTQGKSYTVTAGSYSTTITLSSLIYGSSTGGPGGR